MSNFETVETGERMPNVPPALITRFRWRAERRARKLNAQRPGLPSYRWEVCNWLDGRTAVVAMHTRWAVVAMQNGLYNAEAYEGGPGEIPRRQPQSGQAAR